MSLLRIIYFESVDFHKFSASQGCAHPSRNSDATNLGLQHDAEHVALWRMVTYDQAKRFIDFVNAMKRKRWHQQLHILAGIFLEHFGNAPGVRLVPEVRSRRTCILLYVFPAV